MTESDDAPRPHHGAARRGVPTTQASVLAQLNRHIADVTGQPQAARTELRSAQAFRDTWERLHAEDEVHQALQRGPENPGPLNPHRLVLRTLGLLSELSPEYLRRFMAHADALLWLDEASALLKPSPTVKARKARSKA
ncbi:MULTISPECIES: DUF2894 domain-containing protein [Hydrogenophaga]|uniref:DUF2894 domain-containing protein n=1 Tax=Hydrogenophaga intermedia TaxID=65786 RepID=A0A1L1PFJ7_HYDIT|nr:MULTISPECIES: DUF2894 domain-containing protein [Hydrogenophaga]AOS78256.1 hypothetical protein Q5W_04335 [Hydrogenophaga sp. PBC]CDN87524.1 hypothetical protein BN948_01946 [Hydrogenophaga intermedia]